MKVLFITSTRIGDAVLSTSILNHIKNKFPHSSLYIATGKTSASLFKNFHNVFVETPGFTVLRLYLKAGWADMDIITKSVAINQINKISEMDTSSGEYSKMDY